MKRTLAVSVLLVAGLAAAYYIAAVTTPGPPSTRGEVTAAITRLERGFTGPEAAAARKVIRAFDPEGQAVMIYRTEETTPWRFEKWTAVAPGVAKEIRAALDTAHEAGCIRAQLAAGKPGYDPYPGWLMVIKARQELWAKHPAWTSPGIEELEKLERHGRLRMYAAELRLRLPRD